MNSSKVFNANSHIRPAVLWLNARASRLERESLAGFVKLQDYLRVPMRILPRTHRHATPIRAAPQKANDFLRYEVRDFRDA